MWLNSVYMTMVGQARRAGSFPGPRDVWEPAIAQKYWKCVPDGFFLTSNMHKIHVQPDPAGVLTTFPQTCSELPTAFKTVPGSVARLRCSRPSVEVGAREFSRFTRGHR